MIHSSLNRLFFALAAIALPLSAFAQPDNPQAPEKRVGDPYPLATCPVSGEKLGTMGDAVVKVYDGREVRFCCAGCPDKFEAKAEDYWKKIDAQIVKLQEERYPMDTCLVSGEKLGGEMGDPVKLVYNNRLVQFCCKGCVKDFKAEPEKFLKQLDEAVIESQKEDYPLGTCVVSEEPLGGAMGEPIDAVYANQLVRFCCKGCKKDFEESPAKFLEKIDAARKSKTSDAGTAGGAMPEHDHQSAHTEHMIH
ncbi:hypothetical protein KQH29_00180 [bacterium]|nr:hypothetical protein [bacterium]